MPPKWLITSLFLFALLQSFTFLTNNLYNLAWEKTLHITTAEGFKLMVLIPGLWNKYSLIIYHFGVDFIILFLTIPAIAKHKHPYRAQFQVLSFAMIFSIFISFLYIMQIVSFGPYNPIPASFALTTSMIAFGFFKYKMIDISPYARESVFEIINTPVIITDQNERLIDFNDSARRAFKLSQDMIASNITEIFEMINLDYKSLKENENTILETKWGAGKNYKYSAMKKSVNKGSLNGFFVIFTDVTTQMDSIKTEHEKEIVTYKESILGDMHDGIGGVVATAAIIAQAAMEEEGIQEKNKMIGQIANLLENGSFELRSMLNILDKEKIGWQTLVYDMRSYSSTVLDSKGITREFKVNGEPYSDKIDFDFYLSVFRLFKECITNIIKHSEAEKAFISISFDIDTFRFTIRDDGKGVDGKSSSGYGIKNMQRRADKLGGTFEIISDKGTNVNICIPI